MMALVAAGKVAFAVIGKIAVVALGKIATVAIGGLLPGILRTRHSSVRASGHNQPC